MPFSSEVTLQKLCYDLGNLTRGGYQSDDEPLSDREKMFIVNGCRATLIERELQKGRELSKIFEQSLRNLEVIPVDFNECTKFGGHTKILRTKDRLPKLVRDPFDTDGVGITYIGSNDNFNEMQRLNSIRLRWHRFAKYTSTMPASVYLNGYIYLPMDRALEQITVRGYFADPITAGNADNCEDCNNKCIDWKSPYPFAEGWIDALNKLAYSTDINILLKGETDTKNDSSGQVEDASVNANRQVQTNENN